MRRFLSAEIVRAGGAAILAFSASQALSLWLLLVSVESGKILPFLFLVESWNTGINFGLFSGQGAWQPFVLAAIAIVAGGALMWWTAGKPSPRHNLACGLIAGGAWSNGLQRIAFGAVHDYINVSVPSIGFRNPFAFNLADAFIFVGIGLVFLMGSVQE